MTAAAIATGRGARPRGATRIGSVVRLHFTNPTTFIVTPMIVLGAILLLNLAIWLIVVISSPGDRDVAEGFSYSGSSFWIFVYLAVVAIQAMNATFRLALGYGATRRDYYLGSALAFAALSVGYTAVLTVLGLIEKATNGWGLQGAMFTPVYFGPSWGDRIVVELCLFLFFLFAGSAFGAVFVRWRRTGLLILGGILLGILALAGLAIALLQGWGSLVAWLGSTPPWAMALWGLVPTAAFGLVGFLVLRRATPRS